MQATWNPKLKLKQLGLMSGHAALRDHLIAPAGWQELARLQFLN